MLDWHAHVNTFSTVLIFDGYSFGAHNQIIEN